MSVFIGIPMSLKVSPMSVTSRLCVIVWGYFYLYNMSQWAAMGYFMYQPVSLESCAFILICITVSKHFCPSPAMLVFWFRTGPSIKASVDGREPLRLSI